MIKDLGHFVKAMYEGGNGGVLITMFHREETVAAATAVTIVCAWTQWCMDLWPKPNECVLQAKKVTTLEPSGAVQGYSIILPRIMT